MKRYLAITIALFAITGCSNKFESISDEDLADKRYDCRSVKEQSPGMAIQCDNVERECLRRREEGKFVC